MTFRLRLAAAAAALLALTPMAFADASFNDAQKKEIGEIVRQYLLENPEVLLDVSKALEARQQQQEEEQRTAVLKSSAKEIFHSPNDYVAGNPKGDVTIVEFFDYNCGWCKKGFPEVMSLIEQDKNLRFVLKEFPIFGGDSDYAAMAAIAAKKQNKYWELHQAMFQHEGKITKEAVDELATKHGIDLAKLKADMKDPSVAQELADNHQLAQSLAINGTPGFIIDDKVSPGYLPADSLAQIIDEVRKKGGCTLC
ncbi:DsbA family protein [Aestuariivirga litoralis]|uniref:DsbA family protein n=1 Tax=Aestuariivirga litoralis TaxID=2650924 RepID=A0A2W2BJ51_9HYPH|nr:DsbA family protein [Aestuariivirga litoralis]PZF76209.1 DsbA family protein [Aestuariivirga litoralis]